MSAAKKAARTALLSLGACALLALALASAAWAGGGNSEAARACKDGGFKSLVGTQGQTFDNQGQCVSYAVKGGTFASGIIIPKGHTATLTNARFAAFNALTYGYQLDFGANVDVGSQEEGGENQKTPDVTVGPFSTAELIRVFLTDDTCGFTFYSDGNHAEVTGSNPFNVEINDGGAGCELPPSVERKDGSQNLVLTLTVN